MILKPKFFAEKNGGRVEQEFEKLSGPQQEVNGCAVQPLTVEYKHEMHDPYMKRLSLIFQKGNAV